MTRVFVTLNSLSRMGNWLLPSVGHLVFVAVLLAYFWSSAFIKPDGPFTPSIAASARIYPRAIDAAGYDPGDLGPFPCFIVLLGGLSEILPSGRFCRSSR